VNEQRKEGAPVGSQEEWMKINSGLSGKSDLRSEPEKHKCTVKRTTQKEATHFSIEIPTKFTCNPQRLPSSLPYLIGN
jgi:hypothetical protein